MAAGGFCAAACKRCPVSGTGGVDAGGCAGQAISALRLGGASPQQPAEPRGISRLAPAAQHPAPRPPLPLPAVIDSEAPPAADNATAPACGEGPARAAGRLAGSCGLRGRPPPCVPQSAHQPAAHTTPAPVCSAPACAVDVAPPGLLSCSQQKDWGMCEALSDTGFCAVACGRCTPNATNAPCDDLPTPDAVPCSRARAGGGRSAARRLALARAAAIGVRQGSAPALRHPPHPLHSLTPPQTAADGRCSSPYVEQGGYCRATCGRCQLGGAAAVQAICDDVPTPDGVTCLVRGLRRRGREGGRVGGWRSQGQVGGLCWRPAETLLLHLPTCLPARPPACPSHACPRPPQEQRTYGACNSSYLALGGYCDLTCGRCGAGAQQQQQQPAPAPATDGGGATVAAASGRPNGGRRLAASL